MSIVDMHEVNFEWPYNNPKTVIVTGTFDEWQSTYRLTPTPTGFVGSIKIPWNQKILYKFIVDGHWVLRYDRPTETDPRNGFVNHVYIAPPKPIYHADSSSSDSVSVDAGKHKGHGKGVNGAISNGIIGETPERKVQVIALPSPDKLDRPSGGEPLPNITRPAEKEAHVASNLPGVIVPVDDRKSSTLPSSSLPAGVVSTVAPEASGKPAKVVAEEKAEPKSAEVPESFNKGAKVEKPDASTAVEDKHGKAPAETSHKEKPTSTPAHGPELAAPSSETTSSSSSSSRSKSKRGRKKRMSSFLEKIKDLFQSAKEKIKDKTK